MSNEPRVFMFNGQKLADPDPNLSVNDVKKMYANHGYAALTNATANEEVKDGKRFVTFKASAGTKG